MDLTKTEITFNMSAGNVTFKATYLSVVKYEIYVVDGTKDKSPAKAGETVTINANPAKEGKVFDKGVYTSDTGLSAFVPFSRTIFLRRRLNKNETGVILSIDKRKIFLYNVSHLSHETVLRHSFEQTKNIFGEQLTYENCTDYIKYSGHNIYAVVPVPDFVYRGGYLCP